MGAIQNWLQRRGLVKLGQYGLILTPDGRILSTRPAVLDDGLGGRIVGWLEGDLAAMELERWPAKEVAPIASIASFKRSLPGVAPITEPVVAAPVRVEVAVAVPVVTSKPTIVAAPEVAVSPPVEEDEWEWEIAVARARAAAEWSEEEAATAAAAPAMIEAQTIDPPESWGTQQQHTHTITPYTIAPRRGPHIVSRASLTVIPVPTLPTTTDPRSVRAQVEPRRFARATGRIGDETVRTRPAPANDDLTSPAIALPPAGANRVAAKR